ARPGELSGARLADLLGLLAGRPDLAGELAELAAGLADLLAHVTEVDLRPRHRDAEDLAVSLKRRATQDHSAGDAGGGAGHRQDDVRDSAAHRAVRPPGIAAAGAPGGRPQRRRPPRPGP